MQKLSPTEEIEQEVHEFKVLENHRKPGYPIFVNQEGKVGFPGFGSIPISIGQTIKGVIVYEHNNYFLVRVQEVV